MPTARAASAIRRVLAYASVVAACTGKGRRRAGAQRPGGEVGFAHRAQPVELRPSAVGQAGVGDPPVGGAGHPLDVPGRLHAVDQPRHATGREADILGEAAHREPAAGTAADRLVSPPAGR